MDSTQLLDRRNRFLGSPTPLFYSSPVHIIRGEGPYLFGADGTRYVDMYNNVPCVGHCNPRVVEAMHRQASTLNVHSRYLHEAIVDYAERLTGKHASHLNQAVFACTGTEANEIALRMARIATGGQGVICTDSAYHGNSAEVGKLTRAGGKTDAVIGAIPFPQSYRPLVENVSAEKLGAAYLDQLDQVIARMKAEQIRPAAMLVCPILANEGLPDIPGDFMCQAAQRIRDAGGLFVVDEVQSGFGRTGHWWGYEKMGVEPDIVAMGKPMGNGLPLSGVIARPEIVAAFREQTRYFNTFASSPLQAAVGMAVIDELEDRNLVENAATLGANMKRQLQSIAHRQVGDVRGHGLFLGVEWVKDRDTREPDRDGAIKVVDALKEKGFLISNAGALGNVLKIRPPLVFEQTHADQFLHAYEDTLRSMP